MSFYDETRNEDQLGTTLLEIGSQKREVKHDEKLQALQKAYEDPLIKILSDILEEEEVHEDTHLEEEQGHTHEEEEHGHTHEEEEQEEETTTTVSPLLSRLRRLFSTQERSEPEPSDP